MISSLVMALLLANAPVLQERSDIDVAQRPILDAASAAVLNGQPQLALDTIEPAIKAYQDDLRTEKRRPYCGMTGEQSLAYMAMAASEKVDAVIVGPAYCEALYIKGFALIDLKRGTNARATYEQLIALAPWHAHFLTELGQSYRLDGNWARMLELCSRANEVAGLADKEQIASEQGASWRCMGYALVEQEKFDEAEALYRKCIALDPADAKAKEELQYITEQRAKKASTPPSTAKAS